MGKKKEIVRGQICNLTYENIYLTQTTKQNRIFHCYPISWLLKLIFKNKNLILSYNVIRNKRKISEENRWQIFLSPWLFRNFHLFWRKSNSGIIIFREAGPHRNSNSINHTTTISMFPFSSEEILDKKIRFRIANT